MFVEWSKDRFTLRSSSALHIGTVVRQGRHPKSMEIGKAWNSMPSSRKAWTPMATKIFMGECTPDTYRDVKFHYDATRRFCLLRICEVATECSLGYFLGGSATSYPKAVATRFTPSTSKHVVFARMCLLGPRNIMTAFSPKIEALGPKKALTWETSINILKTWRKLDVE